MDEDEDGYSDRDASGEDDTDFIDAGLSSRVAPDPALAEQGTTSNHNGYAEDLQQYDGGYAQGYDAYVSRDGIC
jgi:hypothetical protein